MRKRHAQTLGKRWECGLDSTDFVWYNLRTRTGRELNWEGRLVKEGIHPKYVNAKVTCACGNSFETRSTAGDIKLDICSNCHPFYTGKQKIVDAEGRVEKFLSKYGMKKTEEQQ
jgi:large subunit ribosomal protein L31